MSQPRDPYRPRPPVMQRPPVPPVPPAVRRPRRIPGLGLILTALSLVIQVLSLTVLPWVSYDARTPFSLSMPEIWDAATDFGTHGFGAWYVVLFSYPLAALGIVLALAAVLDSVVLKVIWGGLALLGLGVLVLRYGLGPIAELAVTDNDTLSFSTQEITTALIALAAGIVVIFALRMALSTFRRVAGLILLGLAGVHIAAVLDLVRGSAPENLSIGAYGPAVGYALAAVAVFIGPRGIPGVRS